jgi:hypothetical protein
VKNPAAVFERWVVAESVGRVVLNQMAFGFDLQTPVHTLVVVQIYWAVRQASWLGIEFRDWDSFAVEMDFLAQETEKIVCFVDNMTWHLKEMHLETEKVVAAVEILSDLSTFHLQQS